MQITENVLAILASEPIERVVTVIDGDSVSVVAVSVAFEIARRDVLEYRLVMRRGHVRKMIRTRQLAPAWKECYRTTRSTAYSPWPGFDARYA